MTITPQPRKYTTPLIDKLVVELINCEFTEYRVKIVDGGFMPQRKKRFLFIPYWSDINWKPESTPDYAEMAIKNYIKRQSK